MTENLQGLFDDFFREASCPYVYTNRNVQILLDYLEQNKYPRPTAENIRIAATQSKSLLQLKPPAPPKLVGTAVYQGQNGEIKLPVVQDKQGFHLQTPELYPVVRHLLCMEGVTIPFVRYELPGGSKQLPPPIENKPVLPDVDRVYYVAGFVNGYTQGQNDTHALAVMLTPEQSKSFWGEGEGIPFVPDINDLRIHVIAGGSTRATMGEIVGTVSSLYMDFRNMPICWDSAILMAKESLLGHSPSDEELARARAWDARFGCG